MIITKALQEEYDSVRLFYHSMIDALEGNPYHPKWQKDIYPSQEDLKSAIEGGELYIGRIDNRIASAMVLNQKCNPEYDDVRWPIELDRTEFMVIHMLGVHNDFAGHGLAKEMVRFAIDTAEAARMKAIRLDVLKGNVPAERLYPSMDFIYVDTIKLFYEDTGRVDFELYELELGESSVKPLFKEEREMKAESPITEEKLVDIAESLSSIKSSLVEIMEDLEGREAIDPVDEAIESVEDAIDALYEAVDSIEEEEFEDDEEAEEEEEADVEGTEVLNRTVKFGNKEINVIISKDK